MLERFVSAGARFARRCASWKINGLVILKPGPKAGPVVADQDPAAFGQVMTLHLQSLGATYRELLQARVEYEVGDPPSRRTQRRPARPAGRLRRLGLRLPGSCAGPRCGTRGKQALPIIHAYG
jgi:hypothetical protein